MYSIFVQAVLFQNGTTKLGKKSNISYETIPMAPIGEYAIGNQIWKKDFYIMQTPNQALYTEPPTLFGNRKNPPLRGRNKK